MTLDEEYDEPSKGDAESIGDKVVNVKATIR